LFRQLAVFTGGFSFEAAEAVFRLQPDDPQSDFLDLLTSLVDKSLLVTKERRDSGETRFQMLEVVREYALELLKASGEADEVNRRHFEYFLALGEEAETHLLDVNGVQWLNRLEEDHENLRSALEWSLERKTVEAARLAGAIRNFWSLHCHFTEARHISMSVLERGGSEIPAGVRFKLLNGLGSFTRMQGDNAAAEKAYEQGLAEGKAANDRRQIAHANRGLGLVNFQRGDLAATRKYMEESLTILRELDDKFGIALTLTSLGDLERAEGNIAAARPLFEESLTFCRQLNNNGALCSNLINLGAISFDEGNFEDSYLYFAASLATAQELEDKSQISLCLDGFAALTVKRGDYSLAARIAGAAEHLRKQIGYEIEPTERRFQNAFLSELKNQMDETDFSNFYEQGQKLKLAESIALTKNPEH
jgi:non-specific serine/threonine protein kinase